MTRTYSLFLTALLLAPIPAARAAELQGHVSDQDGAPILTAIVRAKNLATKITEIGLTDPQGRYYLPHLPDGAYAVSVSKKGFAAPKDTATQHIDLKSAGTVDLSLRETAFVALAQLSTSDIARHLPEAPGKREFVDTCGNCHGLERALEAGGRDKADWQDVIKRMGDIPGGYLTVNDRTKVAVLDYAAKILPPGTKLIDEIAAAVKKDEPELPQGHELVYTEYDMPTENSTPHTVFPDRAGTTAWFSEYGSGIIGRLNVRSGVVKEIPLKTPDHHPHGVTIAPDGFVWAAVPPRMLAKVDPKTDKIDEIKIPAFADGEDPYPHSLMFGSDGKVWFSETHRPAPGAISSYDPATGKFQRYMLDAGCEPYGIIEHDGRVWFTMMIPGKIAVLDPKTGKMEQYPLPTKDTSVRRMRFDSKGRIWFGELATAKFGMFDPVTKRMDEYELPYRATPYSIHIDGNDNIWLGAFDRDSFIRYDPAKHMMTEYPLPKTGVIIRDMWPDAPDKLNHWWFAQSGWNQATNVEFVKKPQSTASAP